MVVIDNFDIGQSRDSLYEEGDINDTISPSLQLMTRLLEMTRAMVFIDNIDIELPGDSLYEGGDINYTIPSHQLMTRWWEVTRAIT